MDFAAALPAGLDTVIGERGLGISGGEAQRVALARAFLDNAPLLVLDEPTAHLDADSEVALIETIAALARGKTLVLATHSVALLALCERVLSLDEGIVVKDIIRTGVSGGRTGESVERTGARPPPPRAASPCPYMSPGAPPDGLTEGVFHA